MEVRAISLFRPELIRWMIGMSCAQQSGSRGDKSLYKSDVRGSSKLACEQKEQQQTQVQASTDGIVFIYRVRVRW